MPIPSLTRVLRNGTEKKAPKHHDKLLADLQLRMLVIQQGLHLSKCRAIVAIEGFDAAGKGGAIQHLTGTLDPRGYAVHPIGPPDPVEQGKHWLYRFWTKLPAPGELAIFDRTWYGRVLVERVDKLTPERDWKRGYAEIRQFEEMLAHDGVDVIKIFLAISKKEQKNRFIERLENPYKQWKLGDADLHARKNWDKYVEAADELFKKTHSTLLPWHLVAADNKAHARLEVLRIVTERLHRHHRWIEKKTEKLQKKSAREALKALR